MIANANMLKESFKVSDKDNSLADKIGKHGNRDNDMDFGLFN